MTGPDILFFVMAALVYHLAHTKADSANSMSVPAEQCLFGGGRVLQLWTHPMQTLSLSSSDTHTVLH